MARDLEIHGKDAAALSGAHSTLAFAAIGDHARLPWRFFARLFASDGSLPAR